VDRSLRRQHKLQFAEQRGKLVLGFEAGFSELSAPFPVVLPLERETISKGLPSHYLGSDRGNHEHRSRESFLPS